MPRCEDSVAQVVRLGGHDHLRKLVKRGVILRLAGEAERVRGNLIRDESIGAFYWLKGFGCANRNYIKNLNLFPKKHVRLLFHQGSPLICFGGFGAALPGWSGGGRQAQAHPGALFLQPSLAGKPGN